MEIKTTRMCARQKLNKKNQLYLENLLDDDFRIDWDKRYDAHLVFYDESFWTNSANIVGSCAESIRAGWVPDLIIAPTEAILIDLILCEFLEPIRFENVIVCYVAPTPHELPLTLLKACNLIYDYREDEHIVIDYEADLGIAYKIPVPNRNIVCKAHDIFEYTAHSIRDLFSLKMKGHWSDIESGMGVLGYAQWMDAICRNEPNKRTSADIAANPYIMRLLNSSNSKDPFDFKSDDLHFYYDRNDASTQALLILKSRIEKVALWLNYMQFNGYAPDIAERYDSIEKNSPDAVFASAQIFCKIDEWLNDNCIGTIPYGAIESSRSINYVPTLTESLNTIPS